MTWLPLSSAPRDGTPIDLWHVKGFRVTEVWWDQDDGCWSSCNEDADFSHWMLPPAAPGQEQSTQLVASAILGGLQLAAAPSDTVRAQLLLALASYGQELQNPALVAAAQGAMPQANPFSPPKEWKAQYEDGFRGTADPECGVDPSADATRCAYEYWQMMGDTERNERVSNPDLGFTDGEKDATALNDA